MKINSKKRSDILNSIQEKFEDKKSVDSGYTHIFYKNLSLDDFSRILQMSEYIMKHSNIAIFFSESFSQTDRHHKKGHYLNIFRKYLALSFDRDNYKISNSNIYGFSINFNLMEEENIEYTIDMTISCGFILSFDINYQDKHYLISIRDDLN